MIQTGKKTQPSADVTQSLELNLTCNPLNVRFDADLVLCLC